MYVCLYTLYAATLYVFVNNTYYLCTSYINIVNDVCVRFKFVVCDCVEAAR